MNFIMRYILDKDADNLILLNDEAPVMAIWAGEEEDYTIKGSLIVKSHLFNEILRLLNSKYRDVLAPELSAQSQYENRIQFFMSYNTFWENIQSNEFLSLELSYYNIVEYDGTHFSYRGYEVWGRMIAKKLGAVGWYELQPDLCSGDTEAPTFILPDPDSDVISGVQPAGIAMDTISFDFEINDNSGTILDYTGADYVIGNTYRVYLNPNLDGSQSVTVAAKDYCNNQNSFTLNYERIVTGWVFWEDLWWYFYEISYNFSY